MMQTSLKKTVLAAMLSAVAMAGVGSANAAVYSGKWDPAYGAPFTNLGWQG